MLATVATTTQATNPVVGKLERPWRPDEPVLLSRHQSGPDEPFASLDDAIAGAAFMSQTGRDGSVMGYKRDAAFVITKDGDAFRATRLLTPLWKHSWGVDRMTGDTLPLVARNPVVQGADRVAVDFRVSRTNGWGSTSSTSARGTLRLDPALGALAIVAGDWAFVDGQLRTVEAKDPFPPPPPPPPPPPAHPILRSAIDDINESIRLIETVPMTDKGDASTKDARIAAFNANMAAQGKIEDIFLRDNISNELTSSLRQVDAYLEDANWQLARKPSPDGRFNGVDIPGALRDSRAALDLLTGVVQQLPEDA